MSPAKRTSRRSSTSKKTTQKGGAKKTTAKKAATKKSTVKKTTAKKTTATKATKATAKKAAKATANKPTPRKKTTARKTAASTARSSRAARPAKLDKKTLDQIRATLESERNDLFQRQAELEQDSFDATQSDMTGEVGLDEDFADAGTATFERERDLSIRNNIRDLIDQMTRAIGRIDEGTYGICERCGKPIPADRLEAMPDATTHVSC